MIARRITITNELGLHARAAAKFVNVASQFKADVYLVHNSTRVNGKSIMGIMMLAAGKGAEIELEIDGADEQQAMAELAGLIEDGFGEES